MTTDVTVYEPLAVMPVLDIRAATVRRQAMVDFVKTIMTEGTDYGTIPGTDKPTLLKPGAEKLTTFFGLSKQFVIIERTEDWTGNDHGGEPFFFYLYRARLFRGDVLIAESDGSCSSWESKYRYRNAERTCPDCGKPNIRKSNKTEEFYCWVKTGGCGGKFALNDKRITQQIVGKVPNPDPADIVNTVQKMAQKRALIAATLLAVNASEFFTQDVEDFVDADYTVTTGATVTVSKPTAPQKAQPTSSGNGYDADADLASIPGAYEQQQAARQPAALQPAPQSNLPFRPTIAGAVEWAMKTHPVVWPVANDGTIVRDVVERSFRKLMDDGLRGEALAQAWIAKCAEKQADHDKPPVVQSNEIPFSIAPVPAPALVEPEPADVVEVPLFS